jgi:hypothetical protein
MSERGETLLRWTDATGTIWRISRRYVRCRQQWEAEIESKSRETWLVRYRMVLDAKEVFERGE